MSDDRPIPQRMPIVQRTAPGTYFFCHCGRSQAQPFCDGSHAGTGLEPIEVTIEEERNVAWCCCKRSESEPFCDGSHAGLPRE